MVGKYSRHFASERIREEDKIMNNTIKQTEETEAEKEEKSLREPEINPHTHPPISNLKDSRVEDYPLICVPAVRYSLKSVGTVWE